MRYYVVLLHVSDEGTTPAKRFTEGTEADAERYLTKEEIQDLIVLDACPEAVTYRVLEVKEIAST